MYINVYFHVSMYMCIQEGCSKSSWIYPYILRFNLVTPQNTFETLLQI